MAVSVLRMSDRAIVYTDDADQTPDVDVLGGPCTLHAVHVLNDADSFGYLHLFDTKTSPTLGTTDAEMKVKVEKSTTGALNAGKVSWAVNPPDGHPFATGLTLAMTTGADGTGSPGANDLDLTLECTEG